jgi:hypothetical protein
MPLSGSSSVIRFSLQMIGQAEKARWLPWEIGLMAGRKPTGPRDGVIQISLCGPSCLLDLSVVPGQNRISILDKDFALSSSFRGNLRQRCEQWGKLDGRPEKRQCASFLPLVRVPSRRSARGRPFCHSESDRRFFSETDPEPTLVVQNIVGEFDPDESTESIDSVKFVARAHIRHQWMKRPRFLNWTAIQGLCIARNFVLNATLFLRLIQFLHFSPLTIRRWIDFGFELCR